METNKYDQVLNYIHSNEELIQFNQPGLCRVWSDKARRLIQEFSKNNNLDIKVEVRQVDLEPCLSHTFLKITFDKESYLLDGTGTAKFEQYFGLEIDSPTHLLNSCRDWLDYI